MNVSLIALLVLGAFLYVAIGAVLLLGAGILSVMPSTRRRGRQLAYATIAVIPGVALGVVCFVVLVFAVGVALALAGKHGQLAGPAGSAWVATVVLSAVLVLGVTGVVSWRIGWAMGTGSGVTEAIRQDRLLGFFRLWRGRPSPSREEASGPTPIRPPGVK